METRTRTEATIPVAEEFAYMCQDLGIAGLETPAQLIELFTAVKKKRGGCNLLDFATNEHNILKEKIGDKWEEMDEAMKNHLETMCAVYSTEGHSGSSAAIALERIKRLFDWMPLSPLDDKPDQWLPSEFPFPKGNVRTFQHLRCSKVFKHETIDPESGAVSVRHKQIEYYIFRDKEGRMYTSSANSTRVITEFPYWPGKGPVLDVHMDTSDTNEEEKRRIEEDAVVAYERAKAVAAHERVKQAMLA